MASKLIMSGFLIRRLFQALNPSVRFLCLEGPARSAKTVEAIEIFFRRVYNSSQKYHCIASQTYETAKDNIVEADTVGLTFTHPNVHWCGKNLTLIGADGKKKVIKVCGFLDAARWKKILGGTIENFLIDEINVANETFIDECFARQLSCEKPFMICTLNGDDPDHFVYQKYINYAKIIGDCPESTRKLVKEFQERNGTRNGFYYCHFKMSDNPVMTAEKLKNAMSTYPVGSYYYITKILGERGIQGDLLFKDYMTDDLLIDAQERLPDGKPKYPLTRFTMGIDIGADRACNVFALVGWPFQLDYCVVLKVQSFKACGYREKTIRLKEFIRSFLNLRDSEKAVNPIFDINGYSLEGIEVDSAEQNYITDLKPLIRQEFDLRVEGSYKSTIKNRIDLMTIGFATKRILFDRAEAGKGFKAYERAKRGKTQDVLREDLNEEKNDIMDAIEYAITKHEKLLMRNGGLK